MLNLNIARKALFIVLALTISIFQSTNIAAADTLIQDNGGPGTSSNGTWKVSAGVSPYGSNSLYASANGASYTFSVGLPTPGDYQVFAWWTAYSNRRTSVPYDITHKTGTSTVNVNQRQNGGTWQKLGGTWTFNNQATIRIRSLGNGTTSADAIKLVYVGNGAVSNNTAPTISGSPATSATAGSNYAFQPSASDADGDTLTFSISNRPPWASFNTSTGRLSGTPGSAATTSNIRISVSDGYTTSTLPAFSITVNSAAPQTGSVSLSWTPPVARADGSALAMSEIAGYTVRYGKSTGNYPNSQSVTGGWSTSTTINNLPVGTTYYMVVSTRDSDGREGAASSMATKLVK